MLMKFLLPAAAALALTANPALARTPSVIDRAPAAAGEADNLAGGTLFLALTAAAAAIVGIVVLADDDEDQPTSP